MVSGEDTIAYSSESSYAANLEMATNEYKPSNRVVTEDQVARVETPGVKSIDEVAAFLNVSEEQPSRPWFILQMRSQLWLYSLAMTNSTKLN